MCDIIHLPDHSEIESLGDLMKRWPEPVMLEGEGICPDLEPDQCICWVDVQATADKYRDPIERWEDWTGWTLRNQLCPLESQQA